MMDCPEKIIGGIHVLDLSEDELMFAKMAIRKNGDKELGKITNALSQNAIRAEGDLSSTVLKLLASDAKRCGNYKMAKLFVKHAKINQ